MSSSPPSWAMGAVGIHSQGDPHLPDGVHLRVFTSPLLGLPVCPFVVYRVTSEQSEDMLSSVLRSDFAWQDTQGRVRTVPTQVQARVPITGTILRNPGERAIAVVVYAGQVNEVHTHRHPDLDTGTTLVVEAFLDTPQGRRIIGRRTEAPYLLTAPQIDGIIISGDARVRSAAWVPAALDRIKRLEPAWFMDLPRPSGARYLGLPDAEVRAEKRVRRGAPQRMGLHDEPAAATPAAASPATETDEWRRVKVLAKELYPHLEDVLENLSDIPQRLGIAQALEDGVQAGAHAEAQISSLGAVMTGSADPGVARWLGMMDMDPDPPTSGIALYVVRAFLPVNGSLLDLGQIFGILAASAGRLTAPESVPGLPDPVPMTSADGSPVFDFIVPVVVAIGAPPDRPAAPTVGAPLTPADLHGASGTQPLQTGDGLGTWLADAVAPDALREIVLPLSGLEAAPSLAVGRQQPDGLVGLNERHPQSDRALALVPAVPEAATDTGTGRYTDRSAPPEGITYRVAQADWWGRWSEWATRGVAAKPRTAPPAPIFSLDYQVAAVEPINDTPRFGTLRLRATVPKPTDLAAGSRPLKSLQVTGTVGGVPVTVTSTLPSPQPSHLDVVVPGPAGMIARSGRVQAVLNARWFDGTEHGPLGEEQRRDLVDPRPPAALVMDPTLRYSARPDAVGRSTIVLSWTGTSGRRYRVYHTDETRLTDVIKERATAGSAAAVALRNAVQSAPDAAFRAQAWANGDPSLFTRELFTNLTETPLAGTNIRYAYDLSGSLKVLAFFKVVALSEDNVESVFTAATLLPVAVPSGGPPPRPLLDFRRFDASGAAVLAVTVVRGPQAAARWRLRRSAAASEDALRMPIIAEGTVPAPAPGSGDGPQVFELVDAGTDSFAGGSLPPWTRLTWRVEVQAESPPGTTLPGEWSLASGPAGSAQIPDPPAPPTSLSLAADVLSWSQPEALRRGVMGNYRFDVYRRLPGGREERINTQVLAADDSTVVGNVSGVRRFRFTDPGHEGAPAPVGTTWRVVTVDPGGRISPPSPPITRS